MVVFWAVFWQIACDYSAEGTDLMMNIWLGEGENKIPIYATHSVGVGGFVMNDAGEVLVVKEVASGDRAQWKLPGGMADLGEDLAECASREVWEETGIKTEFDTLVAFRHRHNEGIGIHSQHFIVNFFQSSVCFPGILAII